MALIPAPQAGSLKKSGLGIAVRYSAGNLLQYATKFNATTDLVVNMGPFNVNNLFGFNQIGTVANSAPLPSTNFGQTVTVIQALSTDMVGPWQIKASANGDAGATIQWTGGGHNSTGAASSSGTPTGRQLSLAMWLDGAPLTADGIVYRGSRLDIKAVNRIQGWNTILTTREILEETVWFTITDAGVEVHNEAMALEALTITRYYGLQASNVGMTSIHWPQDAVDTRRALSGDMNPGSLDTAPNVSRFCLSGASMALVGWMDRAYGLGTMTNLFHTLSPSFVDGTANKTYFYLVRVDDNGVAVAANAYIRWRGGWYFGPDLGATGADLTYTRVNGGKTQYCIDCVTAAAGSYIPVRADDINQTVSVLSSYGSPSIGSKATSKGIPFGITGSGGAVIQVGDNPLFNAPVNGDVMVNPADPTGAAAGAVMMGLGAAGCVFTPVVSKRALVRFVFQATNSVSSSGLTFSLRYGTGTPPANAAGVTGTLLGVAQTKAQGFAAYTDGETADGLLLSLIPGTTYWFDLTLAQISSGTASIKNITFTAIEI